MKTRLPVLLALFMTVATAKVILQTGFTNTTVSDQIIRNVHLYQQGNPDRTVPWDFDLDRFEFLLPPGFLDKVHRFVKSFSVRPLEFNLGWMRDYQFGTRMSHLEAHIDGAEDEVSVILQFVDGAFLFLYPEGTTPHGKVIGYDGDTASRVQGVSAQEPSTLPLVDMDAGDILMYHGHQHFHGCRGLVEGERRLQMSLFYKTVVQLPQGKGTYGAQAESGREL